MSDGRYKKIMREFKHLHSLMTMIVISHRLAPLLIRNWIPEFFGMAAKQNL